MHEPILGCDLPPVEALAYLGDAVYEVDIRRRLIERGHLKASHLNAEALKYVTAEAQSDSLARIEPLLLDDERDVLRRASNISHPNRPKHAKVAQYRRATGFEAVFGMLYYIHDEERLELLLSAAFSEVIQNDSED